MSNPYTSAVDNEELAEAIGEGHYAHGCPRSTLEAELERCFRELGRSADGWLARALNAYDDAAPKDGPSNL